MTTFPFSRFLSIVQCSSDDTTVFDHHSLSPSFRTAKYHTWHVGLPKPGRLRYPVPNFEMQLVRIRNLDTSASPVETVMDSPSPGMSSLMFQDVPELMLPEAEMYVEQGGVNGQSQDEEEFEESEAAYMTDEEMAELQQFVNQVTYLRDLNQRLLAPITTSFTHHK
ncbi:hypothetical protein NEOLI_000478 [Neolecta irregularis DAH-3]|uniref:Uncharacterized protein n=1 Tax=Neolecta irregularis (strain DAH-3) TaxID=1198029 RepID=A0A1U7LU77_NEOID|nr:hypothetical protein NEOLI_000478 [Neolecta irregularis DAH-3]|eukprot:OLL26071.1 hypothetical protein NEOLI_000478 [Neolecta irregularis DAH-3]